MSDPPTRTRYRVGQCWRFHNDTSEARDILLILAVEEHPTLGILCEVRFTYDPPVEAAPGSYATGGQYWVTQAALDRSVTDLVGEDAPRTGQPGEFQRGSDFWQQGPFLEWVDRTVGDIIHEQTERFKRQLAQIQAMEADPQLTWEAAITTFEQLVAEGDDLAPMFLQLVQILARTVPTSRYRVNAWEECLEIRPFPEQERMQARRLVVFSELGEIRYCLEEHGEEPLDLDPEYWSIHLRGIVVQPSGGHADDTLEHWRCQGGPAEVAKLVVDLLPYLGNAQVPGGHHTEEDKTDVSF